MAKDFKASQVRTTQVIASGSSNSYPNLIVVDASTNGASDFSGGAMNATVLNEVGKDVFVFVSGSKSSFGTNTRGVTLFGGDVVVSGSAYNSTGGPIVSPGGNDTYVQFNDGGSFGGDIGLTYNKVTETLTIAGDLIVNGTTTTINTNNLVVKDPLVYFGSGSALSNQNGGIALASGSASGEALVWGRVANDTWGAGKQDVTAGTTTDLTTMTLVPIRAKKLELDTFGEVQQNYVTSSATGIGINVQVGEFTPTQTLHVSGNNSAYLSLDGPGQAGIVFPLRGGGVGPQIAIDGDDVTDQNTRGLIYDSFGGDHKLTSVLGLVRYVKFTSGSAGNPVAVFELTGSNAANSLTIGTDTNFFVSGAIGGKNGTVNSISVFGGDVAISGTLHGGSPLKIGDTVLLTGSLHLSEMVSAPNVPVNGVAIYAYDDGAGYSKLFWKNGNNVAQEVGTGGVGGAVTGTFNEPSPSSMVTTASVSFSGEKGLAYEAADVGLDVVFFVSGAHADGKRAVFGGDVIFSGSISQGPSSTATGDLAFSQGFQTKASGDYSHSLGALSEAKAIGSLAAGLYTISSGSYQTVVGQYSLESDHVGALIIGNGTAPGDRSDLLRAYGNTVQVTGSVSAYAFSGSLTTLKDGTSYLIAGTNVTIVSGSNGAVTIASSGGSPGGTTGNVQYNNSGSFAGFSVFTFDETDARLTVPQLASTIVTSSFVNGPLSSNLTLQVDKLNTPADPSVVIKNKQSSPTFGYDVFLFASGSISSKNQLERGVTVLGGDTVVSGSLYLERSVIPSIVNPTTSTSGVAPNRTGTITSDLSLGNVFRITLTDNTGSFSTPTNAVDGQQATWIIKQDATGLRLGVWSSAAGGFAWPGGISPTLSTSSNAVDIVTAQYDGQLSKWLATFAKGFS